MLSNRLRPDVECAPWVIEEVKRLEQERDEARANYQFMVDRAANEKLDGYRELGARAAAAENACDALRQWQYEVADGIGYLNRPEGQGGYDVADAETIVQAFKQMERRGDAAADTCDALASLLVDARELLRSQYDPEDCLAMIRRIDDELGEGK